MTDDDDKETTLQDDVARHIDRTRYVRRAWVFGVVALVATLLVAVLSTLLWINSQSNVGRLAASNDSQISQFEYCKTAPKTDPRCQQAVSQPAEKVIQGPQGIQGIQGAMGPMGPMGPRGFQGIQGIQGVAGKPGVTPACWLDVTKCVGKAGTNGQNGKDGQNGLDGKDGLDGTNGVDGKDGQNGTNGVDGKDGQNGTDGKDGATGPPPASWTWTDSQGVTYTCTDTDGDLKYTCVAESSPPPTTPGIVGRVAK